MGKLLVLYINAGSNGLTVVVRRQKINEPNLSIISDNVRVKSEGRDSVLGQQLIR